MIAVDDVVYLSLLNMYSWLANAGTIRNRCWLFPYGEQDWCQIFRRFYEELPAPGSQWAWPEQHELCGESSSCACRSAFETWPVISEGGRVNSGCHRDCFCNSWRLFQNCHSFLPRVRCGSLALSRNICCYLGSFSFTPFKCFLEWIMRQKFVCRLQLPLYHYAEDVYLVVSFWTTHFNHLSLGFCCKLTHTMACLWVCLSLLS